MQQNHNTSPHAPSIANTIGGVGILLSPKALLSLTSVKKISSRIIITNFNGNPATTIISCYSPTNVADEQEGDTFYSELSHASRTAPKHNMLILGGDMNAQLGKNQHGKYALHETTNRNGTHLENFLQENDLCYLNTHFQKKKSELWTHTYPNGIKAQLDYILINKKWINSAHNCEAYSSFEGVSSDYRIVSCKIQLGLRANKTKTLKIPRYDWPQFMCNTNIQDK
ncbi:uncharacterized protein LOC134776500 [Penaeus indicus]|uniref:uncharacterized protein LOC134776500 n=1 Tax=Penaeus indicus TaxID=29960 RepID=UPI00300C6D8D